MLQLYENADTGTTRSESFIYSDVTKSKQGLKQTQSAGGFQKAYQQSTDQGGFVFAAPSGGLRLT